MKTYKYTINGNKYEVAIGDITDNIACVTVNGEEYKVEMEPEAEPEKKKVVVKTGAAKAPEAASEAPGSTGPVDAANAVLAPLPGVITEILVAVGDEVAAGDTVLVLEAMKMANNIEADKAGKVKAILVSQGASVMEDAPLFVIE